VVSSRRETSIVFSGGGARAAYQVGTLRAIAKLMPKGTVQPFPVICGTSAGAINAALLAANADSFRRGVARLVRWWRHIRATDVYRTDLITLLRHAARLVGILGGGGRGPRRPATLLDNAPLATLLRAGIDLARVRAHVESGQLRALGINATSYGTGHAVTFFEGTPDIAEWARARRRGERTRLGIEHLMASAAIPFVFPAVRIAGDYFMDGSVRQIAPLPGEILIRASEVTVGGRRQEHRLQQVEARDDALGRHVGDLANGSDDLRFRHLRRAEAIDIDRNRFGHTDGVRNLHLAPVGQPGRHHVDRQVPGRVGAGTVDL